MEDTCPAAVAKSYSRKTEEKSRRTKKAFFHARVETSGTDWGDILGTGSLAETKCAREDEDDSKLKLDAKQGARPELEIWRGNLAHIFTCNSLLFGKRERQSVRNSLSPESSERSPSARFGQP